MAPKQTEGVEFTAKSLEEALAAAAQSLGVPQSRLDYEVVRDSTRSLFGLVRTGDVTVRVSVRPIATSSAVAQAVDRLLSGSDWPTRPSAADDDTADDTADAEDDEDDWDEDEDDEALDLDDDEPEQETVATAAPPRKRDRQADDVESVATEVVATLLDKMGVLAAVEVSDPGGRASGADKESAPLVLNLVGDDLGVLIGRRGETLRDLQFLTRLIVSRRMGAWPNLVLDVEGYKSRRTTALRSLAKRMADQVRRTHQSVVLEPMPPNERRIVHLALRDDPDVFTESTGEDEARKVQILPKRER
jgi:spoIIIJ-associated protein